MAKKTKQSSQSALSARALLVHVSVSQWVGRRRDSDATDTVNKAFKTTDAAGGYTKKLLPGATELEDVSAIASQIRTFFYDQTLPWMADGTRIIKSTNHLKFAQEFRKLKNQFERAVDDFVNAYPRLQTSAKKTLGNLYKPGEYPDPAEIGKKFKCEVSYLPMPDSGDFRVDISEAEVKKFEAKMKETESAAMADVWSRLHDVTKRAAEKLATPDAIFRDTLIDNIKEMCDLLPVLNISDDKKLEDARKEIEGLIKGMSADTIRENKAVRAKASKQLQDITDKMGAFMGGERK